MSIKILGTGSYLPPRIVTNDDLAKKLDTSDEWIYSHTGIHARHIADEEDCTSTMAAKAARAALTSAGVAPEAFYTFARDHFDRIKKIPIMVVYGAADPIVPFEQQFGTFDLSGCRRLALIGKTGCAHHPHSLDPCDPIVAFLTE